MEYSDIVLSLFPNLNAPLSFPAKPARQLPLLATRERRLGACPPGLRVPFSLASEPLRRCEACRGERVFGAGMEAGERSRLSSVRECAEESPGCDGGEGRSKGDKCDWEAERWGIRQYADYKRSLKTGG